MTRPLVSEKCGRRVGGSVDSCINEQLCSMKTRQHEVNGNTHRSAQRPACSDNCPIRLPPHRASRREEEAIERSGCSQRCGGVVDCKVVVTAVVIATLNAEGARHGKICIMEQADGAPLAVAVVVGAVCDAALALRHEARALGCCGWADACVGWNRGVDSEQSIR